MHLIYRASTTRRQSKDYEFSRVSMLEHWDAGRADTQRTLDDPRWIQRATPRDGRPRLRPRGSEAADKAAAVARTALREHAQAQQPHSPRSP